METIKSVYIIIGIASLALFTCLTIMSDGSEADPSEITVSGIVSGSDYNGNNAWSDTEVNKITIAFVSDDHVVITDVVDKHYSVTLKANHDYNVRSFNNVGFDGVLKTDAVSQMHYIFYKDIHTGESDLTLDVNLTKFYKNYTAEKTTIGKYYLYVIGDTRIATLWNIDDAVKLSNGVVSSDQTIIIPEYVTYEGKQYKVTFVGRGVSAYGPSIFTKPSTTYHGEGTVTLIFKGDVVLNYQPFTAPTANSNAGSQISDKFKFNLVFEKDVYVNSPASYQNNQLMMIPSYNTLTAIENVSIGGIYHGAIRYVQGTITHTTGHFGLANTNFGTIAFDPMLVPTDLNDDTSSMINAKVDSLSLFDGTELVADLDQNTGKYVLKNGDSIICNSVSAVSIKITLTVIDGDSVTCSLVTKGDKIALDAPDAPEGMVFDDWYRDSEYKQKYDPNGVLNTNTTVYAKYTPKEYGISIYGEGITVKNGDNAVANGSKIAFETTLTLAVEERVGYRAIVKMDGAVVSGTSVNVPARDFAISCEWEAIPYIVKCMDGETVVKTIENCHVGGVITLPAAPEKAGLNFDGWMINGLILGAQYVVDYREVGENDTVTLTAAYSSVVKTNWSLTVTGADGKAFWTKTNEIGSYGMITVILGEFEKVDIPASAEYSVGKISDNTFMIYSVNDADITVAVNITAAAKATAYSVSLTEVAKTQGNDVVPGFKATVTAEDGYIDTAGTFLVRYVYKEKDAETGLWCFTTSGQTAGVNDWEIDISEIGTVGTYSKDMYLEKSGAYLVYGFATYAIESASVTGGVEVFTSPVIMSVSQIQAVIGKP